MGNVELTVGDMCILRALSVSKAGPQLDAGFVKTRMLDMMLPSRDNIWVGDREIMITVMTMVMVTNTESKLIKRGSNGHVCFSLDLQCDISISDAITIRY